jgi:dTDP-4-amino-4,6-dideoxygalactose transaminase
MDGNRQEHLRPDPITQEDQDRLRGLERLGWYYEVRELGCKCHMHDIAAVIGLVHLDKPDRSNERRREFPWQFTSAFFDIDRLPVTVFAGRHPRFVSHTMSCGPSRTTL